MNAIFGLVQWWAKVACLAPKTLDLLWGIFPSMSQVCGKSPDCNVSLARQQLFSLSGRDWPLHFACPHIQCIAWHQMLVPEWQDWLCPTNTKPWHPGPSHCDTLGHRRNHENSLVRENDNAPQQRCDFTSFFRDPSREAD